MRYILDKEGYIYNVSFGAEIECSLGTCTEYKGEVPDEFETLNEWHDTQIQENKLNAWKIVDGNLTFDTNRDYKLRMLHEQEEYENGYVTRKELGIKNTNEVNPYANLFPSLESIEAYITATYEETEKVGDTPIEEVNIAVSEEQDLELIELEFVSRNFLPNTATNTSNNGVEYTLNVDKTINVKGTATDKSTLNLAGTNTSVRNILTFKSFSSYAICGLHENIKLEFYHYNGVDRTLVGVYSNDSIVKLENDTNITQVVLTVENGTTIDTTIEPTIKTVGSGDLPLLPMTKYTSKNKFDHTLLDSDEEVEWAYYHSATFKAYAIPMYIGVGNKATASTNVPALTSGNAFYFLNTLSEATSNAINVSKGSQTIEANEDGYVYMAYIKSRTYYEDIKNGTYWMQVEIGETATEYEEYDKKDGQYYVDGVSTQITRSGKNLIHLNDTTTWKGITVNNNNDGTITLNGTAESAIDFWFANGESYLASDYKYVFTTGTKLTQRTNQISGTYTGSYILRTIVYDTDNSEANWGLLVGDKTCTATFNGETRGVELYITSGTVFNNLVLFPQLEVGENATTPEQYGVSPSPDYPSEIINIYEAGSYNAILDNKVYVIELMEDLRGLPNGIGDRLWINTKNDTSAIQIEKKVGRVVLDGSESWGDQHGTHTKVLNLYTSMSNWGAVKSKKPMLCTIATFSSSTGASNDSIENVCASNSTGVNFLLDLSQSDFTDAVEFKTWLSTHNTEVQYELETYTTESLNYSYYDAKYEEYRNNTVLIDLAGNTFTTADKITIKDNQIVLIKNGATETDNYEYIFLGNTPMPRCYTPFTYAYSHQNIKLSYKYKDPRNIEMSKIDLKGSLTINNIEADNILVNGVSVEENITTNYEIATNTFLNGKRVYKMLFTGTMPSTSGETISLFNYTFEAYQVWIDESMSFLTSAYTTMPINFYSAANDYSRVHVRKNENAVVCKAGSDLSAWQYHIVLAYVKSDGTEEPEQPEENPIVEVNKTSTIDGSTNSSVWDFKTVVIENSIDKTNGTSTVTVENYLGRISSSSYFMGTYTTTYNCGDKTYSETLYKNSGTISAGSWFKLGSHTFTIAHTTEPMTVNVSGSMNTSAFNPSNASASGSITLTTIEKGE